MRFDTLDIIRYGSLTNKVLPFRRNATLHLIYGPNEAGKSSALRSMSDLLFGFPHVARDDHLHDATTLRVGALLSSRNGSELAFRRRRGRKNTLLDNSDDERSLPEDALQPFLGPVDRTVFERAFGLDSDRLRAGGVEMLEHDGEIGSLLFSAASGLTGLSSLRVSLDAEAENIFAQRRSKERLFYQALDRHDDARKLEKLHELRAGDWKKLIEEATHLERELAEVHAQRTQVKLDLHALTLRRSLEPLLREIDLDVNALEGFSDLEHVPASAEPKLNAALASHQEAEQTVTSVQEEVSRLVDALAVCTVNDEIREAAAHIRQLYADKGIYLKAREDLPRIISEAQEFEARLGQLGKRLGIDTNDKSLADQQPTDADLALLRALTMEGRELSRSLTALEKQLSEETQYLNELERNQRPGSSIDPKFFTERLVAIQPTLAEIDKIDLLTVKLARTTADLSEATARLVPSVDDLDAVLAAPLPDLNALTELRKLEDEAATGVRDATSRLSSVRGERQNIIREIDGLEGAENLVTRSDILNSRSSRQILWDKYRDAPTAAAGFAVQAAMNESDRLADLAFAGAERVARHSQLKAQLAEKTHLVDDAVQVEAVAQEAHRQTQSKLAQLFLGVPVSPSTTGQMIEWRRSIAELERQRHTLLELQDDVTKLRLAEQRILPALVSISDEAGFEGAGNLPAVALGRALDRHLSKLAELWQQGRTSEIRRSAAIDKINDLDEQKRRARLSIEKWQSTLSDAAALLKVPFNATIEMIEAALEVWREVPEIVAQRNNRQRRVDGMKRDIAAFEATAAKLVRSTAPDLAGLSVDAAADILQERAQDAEASYRHRRATEEQLTQANARYERCFAALQDAKENLQAISSGLPDAENPIELRLRLKRRNEALERLSSSRRRFAENAEGQSEDAVRASLTDFDRAKAGLEIERLEKADANHFEEYGELSARLAENVRQRRELETGKTAEHAVFERLSAEEEAKELARQWVVLKLAARVLGSSIEAFRETQTDPVMNRASLAFSMLTGGGFSRLVQEYGENDVLHLMAERPTGERVPVKGGLSEGTGDQLYLALRLAFLEDYCLRNEPIPLIADDIFQTFDDDRTAAGLKALASTSKTFQTILFTHQRSVVEIARRELGEGLDLIAM
ncbi:AAA family ATPase [Rhizobium sp. LjRoot258]|uniref:AAA family ATPase n=1 Tax=Rhizobium sp. LjRoot258 TaxID=3342299 RepID=UPI003ECCF121